ncbi:MAG: Na+:solute symporter [Candidatus Krumholzibacteriota bacterium]|nr:Na+:solute symporter [Candidatus Krumholzibacteriota bacterium]
MIAGVPALDAAVVILYLLVVFGIGAALARRASRGTDDFFVAGRSLPWWVIGTSMVATTFAADTPLVVSGLVARGGIWQNWIWWYYGIGAIVAVFLFAPLWRRAGVTTDAELVELRYDGRPAAGLRCFRAAWFGVCQNVLVIAWVMRAMAKIILTVTGWGEGAAVLGMSAEVAVVLALFVVAVGYTALSGLWGVVVTDLLQFALAMFGSIWLAVAALRRLGGIGAVAGTIAARGFDAAAILRIVPTPASLAAANPFTEFLLLVFVVWWASYSVDGGGYLSQRLFAAKNERHATLGFLWYAVAHICLRPWPWILVGLCGMAMLGTVEDPETYYPLMMRRILPAGVFGIVLASFVAAFMSTIDTQLNWGSSLVVNDLLRRFLWKGRSEREYVGAARIAVLVLALLGALASFAVTDISAAWKLILSVTAGVGSVYIARWYWWRVNAWSEITAMAAAILTTGVFALLGRSEAMAGRAFLEFPFSTALTVCVSVPAWVAVTFLTRPVDRRRLEAFVERVRPGGPGWRRVYTARPDLVPRPGGRRTTLRIALGLVALYSSLIGIGRIVLGSPKPGIALVLLALIAAAGLWRASR